MYMTDLPDVANIARNFFNFMESQMNIPRNVVPQYKNCGLKMLNRPHNLYTNIDKKTGEPKSFVISIVYTPFSKDDISVKTKNTSMGKRLVISIDKVEKEEKVKPEDANTEVSAVTKVEKPETELVCEYRGISAKSLRYEFPIDDRVDVKSIIVKAVDGILTIILPVNKQAENELTIPVN